MAHVLRWRPGNNGAAECGERATCDEQNCRAPQPLPVLLPMLWLMLHCAIARGPVRRGCAAALRFGNQDLDSAAAALAATQAVMRSC